MIDLRERFAQLDEIETEDLWWEIWTRAEQDVERVPTPFHPRRRKLVAAVAAAVVIAVLVGVAVLIGIMQEEADPVITQPGPTSTLVPTPPTTVSTPPSTLSAPPSTVPLSSPADILEWTLVTVPSAVDFECPRNAQQQDEYCLGPFGTALSNIAVVDDRLWAVGHDGSAGDWDAIIVTSTDGQSWERVPDPEGLFRGPGDQTVSALVAGNGNLVAVGSTDCKAIGVTYPSTTATAPKGPGLSPQCPQVWVSGDGVGWERVGLNAFVGAEDVPFVNALADDPLVPQLGFPARGYPMLDVTWTGNEFLAVGPAIWRSPDGHTWAVEPWPSTNAKGECSPECRANDVLVTDEGIVAVGKDPTLTASPGGGKVAVWFSEDGRDWRQIQPDLPDWSELHEIVSSPEGYIIVGSADRRPAALAADTFTDARSLSSVKLLSDPSRCCGYASEVVVGGDRIVAVGFQGSNAFLFEGGAARVWVSLDDGLAWQLYPTDDYSLFGTYHSTSHDAQMEAVTLFEDRIIVVGWFNTDAAVWIGTWTDR